MSSKLRVLVIDDSAYNREIICEFLGGHPDFTVVAKAEDGEQGLKLAAQLKPDLITLDIEMPRMDGFTFLRLLMSQMPTPVIVISSHSRKHEIFQALELGALDFVAKPERYLRPELASLKEEIIRKANAVRALQVVPFARRPARLPPMPDLAPPHKVTGKMPLQRLVVIGTSTGGPPALQSVFKAMPPGTPTAFLVAQHMPEKFTQAFAERLNRIAAVEVHEAVDGERVLAGSAYIAPGGSHMEVVFGREGLCIRLVRNVEIDRYVPSVDKLFQSVAQVRGYEVLAAVLTGMGADGALGLAPMKAAGCRIIAESEESAIVFGMPKEAILTQKVDEILPLERIIERMHAFSGSGFAIPLP